MKPRILALAALMLISVSTFAQEDEDPPFSPYFSLEIGTGMAPIHTLSNVALVKRDLSLSENGQAREYDGAWCPNLSLSAAWHSELRWEWVVTAGLSWVHHQMIQYDTFGIDPEGRNRYDTGSYHNIGWKDSDFVAAAFFQARRFWNPTQKVKLYSAAGLGYVFDPSGDFGVVPSLTPIAVRFGTGPMKFFIEHTYSPAATVFDIGLGWSF
jgi:hypothetical protein